MEAYLWENQSHQAQCLEEIDYFLVEEEDYRSASSSFSLDRGGSPGLGRGNAPGKSVVVGKERSLLRPSPDLPVRLSVTSLAAQLQYFRYLTQARTCTSAYHHHQFCPLMSLPIVCYQSMPLSEVQSGSAINCGCLSFIERNASPLNS